MNPVISQAASGDAQDLNAMHTRVKQALSAFRARALSPPPWNGKKVVVYGAGVFGCDVARLLQKQGISVLGFLDQKGSGQEVLGGLRSYSPASPQAGQWLGERPIVLIGTHNPAVSVREISALLAKLGFAEIVTPMEVYLHLGRELGWRFWLGTAEDYAVAAEAIDRARGLWADAESERLFLQTLLYRLQFDLTALPAPFAGSNQYVDPTLPRWTQPIRMVDGGAYTGDTLESLLRHNYPVESFHGFEPDLDNFRQLRENVSRCLPEGESSLWPCGMWSKTTRLNFSEGGGSSSKLSESGGSQVPVVALDDVLHGQPINLIKLDIEGAEADALQGARRIIQTYRPGLAVCLYHYPQHFWSIPTLVADLNLGYTLHCRAYAQSTFETVLYAVPM
jgi:FkbM family methyltransferase